MAVREMGKPAITHFRVIEKFRAYTHLRLKLETGRTHQIRVHLASIRLPIACDKLYGREKTIYPSVLRGKKKPAAEAPLIERPALHAANIRFTHPATAEETSFSAPLADDMSLLVENLRKYRPQGQISSD